MSVTQSGSGQTITVSGGGSTVTITQNGSGGSVNVNPGQSEGRPAAQTASCGASALGASWPQVARPLDPRATLVVPAGSAVPVRFRPQGPCAGAGNLPARLYLAPMSGGDFFPALSADGAPSNRFHYDTRLGEYVYDLRTRGLAPGAYQLGIDLGDGRLYVVPFALR